MLTKVEYSTYYEWQDENGMPHSPDYLTPALVHITGMQLWYHHGRFHRTHDLPAVVVPGNKQEWWIKGYLSRLTENGPARVWDENSNEGVGEEYWLWDLQTDDQGVPLAEPDEWYEPPTQEFLDSLTPEELGLVKHTPTPTPEPTPEPEEVE